jgi:hypothetical protein
VIPARPQFVLRIDTAGCAVDARVNDCPVFQERAGYPGVGELPVSHWMLNGRNSVSFELKPVVGADGFDSDTECTLSLIATDAVTPSSREELTSVSFHWSTDAPPDQRGTAGRLQTLTRRTSATVLTPFPDWTWTQAASQKGDDLPSDLLGLYEDFYLALSRESVDEVSALLAQRDREYAASRLRDVQEQVNETRQEFERLFADPRWTLAPLNLNHCSAVAYGDGRLMRLETPQGKSPIMFEHGDLAYYLSVICTFNRQEGWHISR